ncbi:MAG: hypothetical protein HZB38_16480 [Planctomycetes bacterium]|nr:hypothetical protein [Planctomycetota bacterium]
MKKNKRASVEKRDGSCEAFDFRKLRRGLAAAMEGCGYDQLYADALARAVAIHVEEWREDAPPTTEYLFHCVRTVLQETGLPDVAEAVMRHRRLRQSKRKRTCVLTPGGEKAEPWSKSRVAHSIERNHEIGAGVARILAGEIETRVLGLDFAVVSASLVAELIRNELMAWGLAEAAAGAAPQCGVEASSEETIHE